MKPIPLWGLTGGVGAGKSTALAILRDLGAGTISADEISRELTLPGGAAAPLLMREFGTIERKALRAKIFADPAARAKLEGILHPMIIQESIRRIEQLRVMRKVPVVVYEIPLLVEKDRGRDFDGVLLIEAPQEERIRRITARDKSTREQALAILGAQASDEARRAQASFIVANEGDEKALREALKRWYRQAVSG